MKNITLEMPDAIFNRLLAEAQSIDATLQHTAIGLIDAQMRTLEAYGGLAAELQRQRRIRAIPPDLPPAA